ncbi:IS66-like element accessory protein TnpA [Methylocaldum gracile]|uniref:IS66-like element accessory protein TnpA n=1 Tax=unclassified Methylocaldum TaxID=2622260 RepID=UPI001AE25AB5
MTHDADFTTGVVAMDTLGRRRFAPEFKRELVERTLQPGVSVAGIALAHRINANQLFKWRRHYLKDRNAPSGPPGPTLLPVAMTPVLDSAWAAPAREATVSAPPGTITIEFGGTRVQVKGPVDAATLRTVLASLKGP